MGKIMKDHLGGKILREGCFFSIVVLIEIIHYLFRLNRLSGARTSMKKKCNQFFNYFFYW